MRKRQRLVVGRREGGEREKALEPFDSAAAGGVVSPRRRVATGDELSSRLGPCGEGEECCARVGALWRGCALEATSSPADDVTVQDSAVLPSAASQPAVDTTDAGCTQRAGSTDVAPAEAWPPPPVRGRGRVSGGRARSRHRLSHTSSDAAIDYAHALGFIARVKSTCAPECFPAFLETLLAYQRGKLTVPQVYEQAAALFTAQGDRGDEVLQAFREFLPQGVHAD